MINKNIMNVIFSAAETTVTQHTINLWLNSQLHRPTRISVTINLFYTSILRATYMINENADISRFSKILQARVKVYKCQKKSLSEAKVSFIVLFWFLIKNRFIQKKKIKCQECFHIFLASLYEFDSKIKRLYVFESKTRILM